MNTIEITYYDDYNHIVNNVKDITCVGIYIYANKDEDVVDDFIVQLGGLDIGESSNPALIINKDINEMYTDSCDKLITMYQRDVMQDCFVKEEKEYSKIYDNNKCFIRSEIVKMFGV